MTESEHRNLSEAMRDILFFVPAYRAHPAYLKPRRIGFPNLEEPITGVRLYWSPDHIPTAAPFLALTRPVPFDSYRFHFGTSPELDIIVYAGSISEHDFEIYSAQQFEYIRKFLICMDSGKRERILRTVTGTGNILAF